MALIAKGMTFTPAPDGVHSAVCVDVVDLGMVDGQWGSKHKCRIVWEISEKMNGGKPYLASKQYTLSLNEKANLHKDLKAWRGKPFSTEELAGFNVEAIIGAPCQLVIVHEEKDGIVYGNVTAIIKAKKPVLKACGSYIRVKDRTDSKPVQNVDSDPPDYPEDGDPVYDDIPF